MNKQELLELNKKETEYIIKNYIEETDYGFRLFLESHHWVPLKSKSEERVKIKGSVMFLKTLRKSVFRLTDEGRFYKLILSLLKNEESVDDLFSTFWIWVKENNGRKEIYMLVTAGCFCEMYYKLSCILEEAIDIFLEYNEKKEEL